MDLKMEDYEFGKAMEDLSELIKQKNENKKENNLSLEENLKIGFRRKGFLHDDVIKREFSLKTEDDLDIEEYLYLDLGDKKCLLTRAFVEVNNIPEERLWNAARNNTESDYIVSSMGSFITILTNKKMENGASALLSFQARKEICNKLGTTKFLVLPSSIHEVLILNETDKEIDELNNLVKFVNETQVIPEERLEDKAFFVELYS